MQERIVWIFCWHISYLCLFSAILSISQTPVNLSDNSSVKPHSCKRGKARFGPMALASNRATFSTVMQSGQLGPPLLTAFPFCGLWWWKAVLWFCARCRTNFHSSIVSGMEPRCKMSLLHCLQNKDYSKTTIFELYLYLKGKLAVLISEDFRKSSIINKQIMNRNVLPWLTQVWRFSGEHIASQ